MTAEFISPELGIHKSLRYHAKRRAFFDALQNTAMALATIGGSAAFASLVQYGAAGAPTGSAATGPPFLAMAATRVIAVVTALDLAFGFPRLSRLHDSLYHRFADLASEIARTTNPPNETIRDWQARRLLIEKDEPTALDALNVICHNIEAVARGYDKTQIYWVFWYQSKFASFFTLPPNNFPPLDTSATDQSAPAGDGSSGQPSGPPTAPPATIPAAG